MHHRFFGVAIYNPWCATTHREPSHRRTDGTVSTATPNTWRRQGLECRIGKLLLRGLLSRSRCSVVALYSLYVLLNTLLSCLSLFVHRTQGLILRGRGLAPPKSFVLRRYRALVISRLAGYSPMLTSWIQYYCSGSDCAASAQAIISKASSRSDWAQ